MGTRMGGLGRVAALDLPWSLREDSSKAIEIQLDDVTMKRACRLVEKHGIPLENLVGEVIRLLSQQRVIDDPVLGSLRDEPELVDQMLEQIGKGRARRWLV